jgi:prepilin-type N-terminal cleavage/methylation domain-containing protein
MKMSSNRHDKRRGGFSLLELVIVVAIVAILAAIAIPRMSRGSAGAADSALSANLAILRNGIDVYAAEHGGTFPTATDIADQLTQYTDYFGDAGAKDPNRIYGPYVREIPPLPVGNNKGNTGIAAAPAGGVGWIYTQSSGDISANTTTEADATGKLYSNY